MKTITRVASLMFFATVLGCDKTTAEAPGGKRLTLFKPANQAMRQGETNDIAVMIRRENFDGDVRVVFENLPRGVTVIAVRPIAAGKDREVYTLHAAPDAGLVGNHMASILVEGPDGLKASEFFGVSIRARKIAEK
ncbi:MAG: hypothetical protein FD180_986 [Planctomycetota bacterium]|nr:MAG: hypothetical protein FD180_986 [Planctomycetota bacterium]